MDCFHTFKKGITRYIIINVFVGYGIVFDIKFFKIGKTFKGISVGCTGLPNQAKLCVIYIS